MFYLTFLKLISLHVTVDLLVASFEWKKATSQPLHFCHFGMQYLQELFRISHESVCFPRKIFYVPKDACNLWVTSFVLSQSFITLK
jgi:hypothetical protein